MEATENIFSTHSEEIPVKIVICLEVESTKLLGTLLSQSKWLEPFATV